MKTEKSILIAFMLNLAFSAFEFIGGILTGSVTIISDAIHDIGDAASIGTALFLERKSKRAPDEKHTYGHAGYSVIGSVITTLILLFGSAMVIYNAVIRIIAPTEIHYDGMILLAVFGVGINLGAALLTRRGDSLNQKAVSLHMLEDVLGWTVTLVGAVVMRFSGLHILDPLMSIGVAVFILISALRSLREALSLFLEGVPEGVDMAAIKNHIGKIDGVLGVHHIHIWSVDGHSNYATMHIVAAGDTHAIKERVRKELREHGVGHATLELEAEGEPCREVECHMELTAPRGHHHH